MSINNLIPAKVDESQSAVSFTVAEPVNIMEREVETLEGRSSACAAEGIPVTPRGRSAITGLNKPGIWRLPETISGEELQTAFSSCLKELGSISSRQGSPLSERTKGELQRLADKGDKVEPGKLSPVLYFAGRDLWKSYWSDGSDEAITALKRLSIVLLSWEESKKRDDGSRFQALLLQMSVQLVENELILTSSLGRILDDAPRFYAQMGFTNVPKSGRVRIRQRIIEVHAGICRRLERNIEEGRSRELLNDNRDDLKKIYMEYSRDCRRGPDPGTLSAWRYLESLLPGLAVEIKTSNGEKPPGAICRIIDDEIFCKIVDIGSHRETFDFIDGRLEEIKNMLTLRLGVRISLEHVIRPAGEIYSQKKVVNPVFADALRHIDNKNYKDASDLLAILADRVQGQSRQICRNFQAFALAKQGKATSARSILSSLIDEKCPFSSAYWNCACSLPSDQMSQQLEVLAAGLENAPHPSLLYGSVYLGLIHNDPRLKGWLPMLTFAEALVLAFHLEFSGIREGAYDGNACEHSLQRLGIYVTKQKEPLLLDPLSRKLNPSQAKSHINTLLEYKQEKAIEFWLRCRESVVGNHYDFWQLKAGYLERTYRRFEGARAFRREMKCRLRLLSSQAASNHINQQVKSETESRINHWLEQCMTPELRDIGHDIYNALKDFLRQCDSRLRMKLRDDMVDYYGGGIEQKILAAVKHCEKNLTEISRVSSIRPALDRLIAALDSNGKKGSAEAFRLLIAEWMIYNHLSAGEKYRDRLAKAETACARLREYLKKDLKNIEFSAAAQLLAIFERAAATEKMGQESSEDGKKQINSNDIKLMMVTAGSHCYSDFCETTQLFSVRDKLEELAGALSENGRKASAEALRKLLKEWETSAGHIDNDKLQEVLQRVEAAYDRFKEALKQDLDKEEYPASGQLLSVFERVNRNLIQNLKLSPNLRVEAPDGGQICIDPGAGRPSFAVRISSTPATASPVRLIAGEAHLEDGSATFHLCDKTAEIPVTIGPRASALLTFQTDGATSLEHPGRAIIKLEYELRGDRYHAGPFAVTLSPEPCPALPAASPFIFLRAIETDEIEKVFFGREKEQLQILESVSNGQQKLCLVEGIRRTGKTSLLKSIEYLIDKQKLPLIPVYLKGTDVLSYDHAGQILHNSFEAIARHPLLQDAGIKPPGEDMCISNLPAAYKMFASELAARIPTHRVVALFDDFQLLVEKADDSRTGNTELACGIRAMLDHIRGEATPQARLLWVFASQGMLRQFRNMLPATLLWGILKIIPVDFFDEEVVAKIITNPLSGTNVKIPAETVRRVYEITGGYPEVVQEMADFMLRKASETRRPILTPSDSEAAAFALAEMPEKFASTWYPINELKNEQSALIHDFIRIKKTGERIDPYRLSPHGTITEDLRWAIDDLISRKVLNKAPDGTIGIKAPVLDLWLRQAMPVGDTRGTAAIFYDIANLTSGTGGTVLKGLKTKAGDLGPGDFRLSKIIDLINNYVEGISNTPVARSCAINYPKGSPAVRELNAKGISDIDNIPGELWRKGSDDFYLVNKINEVRRFYPGVSHFVLITGDKDYVPVIKELMIDRKFVHVISRDSNLQQKKTKGSYDYLAKKYPDHLIVKRLEELVEEDGMSPSGRG